MLPIILLQAAGGFDWGQFFNVGNIASWGGAESVLVLFVIGLLVAVIIKHLLGLAIALGALFAILVVVGAASFSLQGFSTLALSIWNFFSAYVPPVEGLITQGGIDSVLTFLVGLVLGYWGLPGVIVHRD